MRRRAEGLGPAARDLIEAARRGEGPTEADRERIRGLIFTKLPGAPGAPAEHGPGSPAAPATPSGSTWALKGGSIAVRWLLVLGGATGAGALLWSVGGGSAAEPSTGAAPITVIEASGETAPVQPAPRAAVSAVAAAASPPISSSPTPTAPAHGKAAAPRPEPGRLAQELALLDQAQRALASGDAAGALAAIEAHARRHPGGKLQEEREAARILALCKSGEPDAAARAAELFFDKWPASALGGRLRASCIRDE